MGLMVAANLANLAGTWVLAAGAGPLPARGWTGIALGTAASMTAAGLLTLGVLRHGCGPLRLPLRLPRPDLSALRQILRIGVPATANWLAMSLVMLWHLAIVGRLGDTALAPMASPSAARPSAGWWPTPSPWRGPPWWGRRWAPDGPTWPAGTAGWRSAGGCCS